MKMLLGNAAQPAMEESADRRSRAAPKWSRFGFSALSNRFAFSVRKTRCTSV